MKKSIFKKIIVSVLSLSLMFSFSGATFGASHAGNGANVVPNSLSFESFSVRDDKWNGGVKTDWQKNIEKKQKEETDKAKADYKAHKITEKQYNARLEEIATWESYTQGYVSAVQCHPKDTLMQIANTGWDGEYDDDGKLTADNPWGLTLTLKKIPVEFSRYYTLDFYIASDLAKDVKDPKTEETVKTRFDKRCMAQIFDYQSRSETALNFETVKVNGAEASADGKFKIKKTPIDKALVKTHVQATFKIPDNNMEWSSGIDKGTNTYAGLKLALGSFQVTNKNEYAEGNADAPDEEVALSGNVYITNLRVLAGSQYTVKYFDGSKHKATRYVNAEAYAPYVALAKKGYNLNGYTNMATGKAFSFNTPVMQNLNLKAKWVKTKKPSKAKFSSKGKKKKVIVTFKKNKRAAGYQVKYSYNKKFKKKAKFKTKTKNTNSTKKYTIKKLKSSKVLYVKARAFSKDSTGKKYYGKWSKRKAVYVK